MQESLRYYNQRRAEGEIVPESIAVSVKELLLFWCVCLQRLKSVGGVVLRHVGHIIGAMLAVGRFTKIEVFLLFIRLKCQD
jgi:hypothetical protein